MPKFRLLLALFILAFFVLMCSSYSDAQYITVTTAPAGCVVDGSGSPITSGTMVIVGTDGNDNPIVYRAGTSAMATTAPVTRLITSGSLGTSLQLADPSQTAPLNVSYRFVIQDNTSKKITIYKNIAITPNDIGNTVFNFCKMNPFPLLTSLGGFSTPSLVSGDWTVTRDLITGRNFSMSAQGVATSGGNFGSGSLSFNGSWWNGSVANAESWSCSESPASTVPNPATSFLLCNHSAGIPGARIQLQDLNPATAGTNFNSPDIDFIGHYWNGSVSSIDEVLFKNIMGSGTNPSLTHTLTHVGTSGLFTGDYSAAASFKFNVVNATTGFQINGVGTAGNVLRGNGTNFVNTQLNASDLNNDSIAGIVWADKAAGADCGAKINNALTTAGTGGEVWVRPACGTSWTTAVTVPTTENLKFYGCATYLMSGVLTVQQNATAKGPQYGNSLGCVTLKAANASNLAAIISLTTGQAEVSNILVDGNKANNATGGVGILAVGAQHNIHDVTVQNTAGHCFQVSSTSQTINNSDSTKITNSMGLNCNGDGAYILNTNDVFLLQDQFENLGVSATVNTAGTAVTATVGSWSTNSSLIGTLVRINNAYFVVSAIPSTTTMTLATTAGTQTGVGLQWGNGIECHDCAGLRFNAGDASAAQEDSVLMYADSSSTGVFNNQINSNEMGNLLGNGVKIIGFDVTANTTQFVTNNLITNNTFTSAAGITNNIYAGVALQDASQTNVIGNRFSTSVGGATHQQIGAVSVTETVASRDVNEIVSMNQVNGTFNTAAADAINCNTTGNCNSVYSCGNGVNGGTTRACGTKAGYSLNGSTTFANLGTPANGTQVFCTDCNATCTAGAGTGRTCFRENGAWTH